VAYVGMTRAQRQLGLTYSAERYGQKTRPSPFLFEIGGKEQRRCIWTGPRSNGADERLPLISESEQRQLIKIAQGTYQGRKVRSRPECPENLGG
jgi:DNA helicase II / ATP-dependent DNA helicase PcrA